MRFVSRTFVPATMCVCVLSLATLLFTGISFSAKASPPATVDSRDQAGAATLVATESLEERSKRQRIEIALAFPGKVDLFFNLHELQTGRPALSQVEVTGVLPVLEGAYLGVWKDGQMWTVKSESIFAVRVHPIK